MNDREQVIQTAVRVPESWLERLDKLAEKLSQPGITLTRTEVLRLALHHGIEKLESEGKKR
jgi:predicted DNA-binding protein